MRLEVGDGRSMRSQTGSKNRPKRHRIGGIERHTAIPLPTDPGHELSFQFLFLTPTADGTEATSAPERPM